MADAAVSAMIDQLTAQIDAVGIPNPCEDMDQTKGTTKIDCESPLSVWRTGGSSRVEWLERQEYVFQLHIFSPPSHATPLTVAYSEREDVCIRVPKYIHSDAY
jgi:hypothetical protein